MSLIIKGIHYVTIAEIAAELGVSRQTLWRWRQKGHIPMGHRYRGRQVILSADECGLVREYAQRLEPVETSDDGQMELFVNHLGSREATRK